MNRERIRAFTLLLRWTGLRIRDAIALRRSMVRGDHIVLRAQKNGKIVKILVRSDGLDALEKVQNPGEYYFWSGLGNPKSCVGDWQRTFRRLSTVSGVQPFIAGGMHSSVEDAESTLSQFMPHGFCLILLQCFPRSYRVSKDSQKILHSRFTNNIVNMLWLPMSTSALFRRCAAIWRYR
jgi:hypothetical protein